MAYKNLLQLEKKEKNKRAGFTIIELITVITIFSILASVALSNFGGFTDAINLSNLAQQGAIYVKKAQTSGSLGKVIGGYNFQPSAFNPGAIPIYGVRFQTLNIPHEFCYFADLDGSGGTDVPCTEKVEQVTISAGYQISNRCVKLP